METVEYHNLPFPVTRSILPNGLTVITGSKQSQLATAMLVVASGSAEDGEHPGTAHFLEHLIYEGPARSGIHPKLSHLYTKGVSGNAYSSTNFAEYCLSGKNNDISAIIKALLAMCFNLDYSAMLVAPEKTVIQQEIREADQEEERFILWLHRALYPTHPAFHHNAAGTIKSVAAINRQILKDFHERYYQPANAALVAVGNVQHQQAVEILQDSQVGFKTNGMKKQTEVLPCQRVKSCFQSNTLASREIMYFPRPNNLREHAYLIMIGSLLDHMPLGLLWQKLRGQKRIIYGARVKASSFPTLRTSIQINALPRHFTYIEEVLRNEIAKIAASDYQEELFQAVRNCLAVAALENRESMTTFDWVDWLADLWLSDTLEDIDPDTVITQATREELAKAATDFLKPEEAGVIQVLPPKKR